MRTPKARSLRKHFLGTYLGLRLGLLAIAVLLPLVLWWGGRLAEGLTLRGSMSAYYHSDLRDVFVGALFAVGALLVAYQGFSRRENRALDLASLFVVGVALIPTTDPDRAAAGPEAGMAGFLTLHGTLAVSFFLCIAYVCVFRATDTLSLIRPDPSRPWYRTREGYRLIYRVIGAFMVLSPAAATLTAYLHRARFGEQTFVFWLEAIAVWSFALFWLVKSLEVRQTNAEQLAADGAIERKTARTPGEIGEVVQVGPLDAGGLPERERRDLAAWLAEGQAGAEANPPA